MTRLAGILLTLAALYLFCIYWPATVSNGAWVTAKTQVERAINR